MAGITFRATNINEDWHLALVDEDGDAIDVSEAEVLLTLVRPSDGSLLLDHEAATYVTNGADGKVTYPFTAEQLTNEAAGTYDVQAEIVPTGEPARSVTTADRVHVKAHYGSHPA